MSSPSLDLSGRLLKGRYRVESALAEGGMGAVYLALDVDLNRRVVVKVPKVELLADAEFRARFEREMRSLIGLDHPSVVKLLDAGEDGGVPYVVLQHLEGGNLGERLASQKAPLDCADVITWLPGVARALDFIHRRGFVHRDIKPGNIMFDGEGNPFVGDFGIARAVGTQDGSVTRTGNLVGSPRFMPPEVGSGDALGPRYDQYSLATVVYNALSGRLPHEAESALTLMTKKVLEPATPLRDVAPDVPPAAEAAIMRALSKDPGQRFASCEEFAGAFAAGARLPSRQGGARTAPALPISAPPREETVAVATGAGRAPRRLRRPFVLLLIALAAILAGWAASLGVRARTQRQAAARAQEQAQEQAQIDAADEAARAAAAEAAAKRAEPEIIAAGPPRVESIALGEVGVAASPWTEVAAPPPSPEPAPAPVATRAPAATPATNPPQPKTSPPQPKAAPPEPAAAVSQPVATPAAAPITRLPVPPPAPAPHRVVGRNAQGFQLMQRLIDGGRMIQIPATTFLMASGAASGGLTHRVSVSAYAIDETEVTWGQWKRYMKARGIQRAKIPSFNPPDEHPVVNVDWESAQSYCEWVGGRLPTEAEWELAARGPHPMAYPWGPTWDDGRANWAGSDDGFPNTAPVGSFPGGASPFGLLDMSGNVSEWVFDFDGEAPEPGAHVEDPSGPPIGDHRIVRGGSWSQQDPARLSATHRSSANPSVIFANYGMRCAMRP